MLTRKPRKGDRVRWPHWPVGKTALVLRTEDGLCWILEEDKPEKSGWNPAPFIWQFANGKMNELAEIVKEGE